MSAMLRRASVRHLTRHPWQLFLAVLGIALGVAVVIAVDLANESARRSFALSTDLVAGETTHYLDGGPRGVPESVYGRLRVELGIRAATPIVSGYAALADRPGRVLQVIGIDLLAGGPARSGAARQALEPTDLIQLLTVPNTVLIPMALANELQIAAGEETELLIGPEQKRVRIAASSKIGALENALIADISTAQELLQQPGFVTRIDLRLPEGNKGTALLEKIRAILPEGVSLENSQSRNRAVAELSASFQLNLTAMSLLALVVGMFLIYNTITFSVVQRRPLLGRLRALGVSQQQIFAVILGEALLLGLAGTALGLLLGAVIGYGLVDLVSRTIDDLYYAVTVRSFVLAPISMAKGILLGLTATCIAALLPAREAAMAPPSQVLRRSDLERKARRGVPRLAFLGAVALVIGCTILLLPVKSISVGFAGLFVLIVGCTLMAPLAVLLIAMGTQWIATRYLGSISRMATRDLARHLSRTGIAVAALMVAVSATVGVGVMVESFRQSVAIWLTDVLNADLYVAPVSFVTGDSAAIIKPEVLDALRAVEGVASLSTYRQAKVMSAGRLTNVIAVDLGLEARAGYRFVLGDADEAWGRFDSEQAVLISEPLAYRVDMEPGDRIELQTPTGPVAFDIAGVFRDYGSEHGRINIRPELYRRYWRDAAVRSTALFAAPGRDLRALARDIELGPGTLQPLHITTSRTIRERSLAIFDRTFTITGVLRLLAVLVAFVGVLSALLAMLLERMREFAVLRANGMLGGEIMGLIGIETGLLGASAGLLAIPTGLLLAAVLIFVINRRAFGWTMQFHVHGGILIEALVLAVVAALLAGIYPALKATRVRPADALRED